MKTPVRITLLLVAITFCGCESKMTSRPDAGDGMDGVMVSYWLDQQNRAAIIRERAFYPHHFDTDTARLNQLGHRNIAVLATYFQSHSGDVHLAPGNQPDALRSARLDAIVAAFGNAGVESAKITATTGLPGGDGISSELVRTMSTGIPAESSNAGSGTMTGFGNTSQTPDSVNYPRSP